MMIMFARNPDKFILSEQPQTVSEWLSARHKREEQKERKRQEAKENDKGKIHDKQDTKRWERITSGLDELEKWMSDHIQRGLAHIPADKRSWDNMVASLVDAQIPTISGKLKRLWNTVGTEGWHIQVGDFFASLSLLIEAARKIDGLPKGLADETKGLLGMHPDKQEIIANGESICGTWFVCGQTFDEDEKLWTRKVRLVEVETGQEAMLLDFSYGAKKFERNFILGESRKMTLAFFPGATFFRSIVKEDLGSATKRTFLGKHINEVLLDISKRLSKNPFQDIHPAFISNATPYVRDNRLFISCDGKSLPTNADFKTTWKLTAAGGGHPLSIFGEWDGRRFFPLAAWSNGKLEWSKESA